MKKTKKDEWIESLQKAALSKQDLELDIVSNFGVSYSQLLNWQLSNLTKVCIEIGRILERMHQRKIKDGKRGRK